MSGTIELPKIKEKLESSGKFTPKQVEDFLSRYQARSQPAGNVTTPVQTQAFSSTPIPNPNPSYHIGPDLLRYGVPLAAGLALSSGAGAALSGSSLALDSLINMGTEMGATTLDQSYAGVDLMSPEAQKERARNGVMVALTNFGLQKYGPSIGKYIWRKGTNLVQKAGSSLLDTTLWAATGGKVVNKTVKAIQKIKNPKMSEATQAADELLGYLSKKSGDDLTLNWAEKGKDAGTLGYTFQQMLRSSFSAKAIFQPFDAKRIEAITGLAKNTLKKLSSEMSPDDYGKLVLDYVKGDQQFTDAIRQNLWREFEQGILSAENPIEVDVRSSIKYLQDPFKKHSDEARMIMGKFVKRFSPFSEIVKQVANEYGLEISSGDLETVIKNMTNDEYDTLLARIDQVMETAEGKRYTMPFEKAHAIYKDMNALFGRKATIKGFSQGAKRELREAITEALPAGLAQDFTTLNDFSHITLDLWDTKVRQAVVNNLKEKPSLVGNLFWGPKASADNLLLFKSTFSDAFGTKIGPQFEEAAAHLTSEKAARRATDTAWMENVILPLRHKIFQGAYDLDGTLNFSKLIDITHQISQYGDKYVKEVIGDPRILDALRKFGQAGVTAQDLAKGGEAKLLVKMAEAYAFMHMVGAATGVGKLSSLAIGKDLTILFAPKTFAKIATNEKLLQKATEAFQAGPRSKAFLRFALVVAQQNIKEAATLKDNTPEEDLYWNTLYDPRRNSATMPQIPQTPQMPQIPQTPMRGIIQ